MPVRRRGRQGPATIDHPDLELELCLPALTKSGEARFWYSRTGSRTLSTDTALVRRIFSVACAIADRITAEVSAGPDWRYEGAEVALQILEGYRARP